MDAPTIIHNAAQLVTLDPKRSSADNPVGVVENASVIVEEGLITCIMPASKVNLGHFDPDAIVDATGCVVMPGWVDSHTHTIFAGERGDEFEWRLSGMDYLEIARRGGGILKTVEATRKASAEELYTLTMGRLERYLAQGVTTVEIKSGYGLDWETEKKCLEVLQKVKRNSHIRIVVTFMGAHDIPVEYKENPQTYVDKVCQEMIPDVAAKGLADCCDVFCETGYFSVEQSRQVLEAARAHGLKTKIHAEEFNHIGGTQLACEMGALSADHLLKINDDDVKALATSNTVATLLPGTAFFLKIADYAPARKLLDGGATVALASDFNPGSSHTQNMQLIASLGCLQMDMSPTEVLQAVTLNAAKALGVHEYRGSITEGKQGDMVVMDIPKYADLFYYLGHNPVKTVIIDGDVVSRVQRPAVPA